MGRHLVEPVQVRVQCLVALAAGLYQASGQMTHGHHHGVEIAGLAVLPLQVAPALVDVRVGLGLGVGAGITAAVLVVKEREPVEQAVLVLDLEEEVESATAHDS